MSNKKSKFDAIAKIIISIEIFLITLLTIIVVVEERSAFAIYPLTALLINFIPTTISMFWLVFAKSDAVFDKYPIFKNLWFQAGLSIVLAAATSFALLATHFDR